MKLVGYGDSLAGRRSIWEHDGRFYTGPVDPVLDASTDRPLGLRPAPLALAGAAAGDLADQALVNFEPEN